MALSMDEQRMLAEIERRLAAENPGLASDLISFRKPGRLNVFRSTRARVIGSLFTVAVVTTVSLMVYAMLPFRSGGRAAAHHPVTTTSSGPGQAKIGAAPGGSSNTARSNTAKTGTGSSASAQPSASSGKSTSTSPSGRAASTSSSTSASAGAPSASTAYAQEHDSGSG